MAEKARDTTESPLVLTAERCHWILVVAHARGHAMGMTREDAEDGAIECVLSLLLQDSQGKLVADLLTDAWYYRAIDNKLKNRALSLRRHRAHELTYTDATSAPGEPFGAVPDARRTPAEAAIADELIARLMDVISAMPEHQRGRFQSLVLDVRHDEPTPGAMSDGARRKARWDFRNRLKALLAEADLPLGEFQDYQRMLRR